MKLFILVLWISLIWTDAVHFNSKARRIEGRIIGGGQTTNEFPFAADIYTLTNDGSYYCTGTLISDRWVLTAGRCVQGARILEIRLGSNSLSSDNPNVQIQSSDTYFLHPDFNGFENDVCLIKLRVPITFTDNIKPVSALSTTTLPDGATVVGSGWIQIGNNSVAGTVDIPDYVYLVSISNEECRLAFGNVITDDLVCVKDDFNQGICWIDGGSPLIQQDDSSLAYLVAISSAISSNRCGSTDPLVFTRISPYVQWINDVTLNN